MQRLWAVLVCAGVVVVSSSCRILSQEVACRLDRDCPRDVGLGYCDVPEDSDGGPGVCVAEDPRSPRVRDGGDDDDPFPDLDGGVPDASIGS